MNGTQSRQSFMTLAQQILHHPQPVEEIGRVIRQMDVAPKERKAGPKQVVVLAAKEMAQGWVDTPCSPGMKPVQDVCRVLLDHIWELERK